KAQERRMSLTNSVTALTRSMRIPAPLRDNAGSISEHGHRSREVQAVTSKREKGAIHGNHASDAGPRSRGRF
ncbi:MAG: hypothetical protein NXI11_10520, partial [Proteobacteria bacterium]|nr:hypothetical protein [Pseudomonadota bacterium]